MSIADDIHGIKTSLPQWMWLNRQIADHYDIQDGDEWEVDGIKLRATQFDDGIYVEVIPRGRVS